MNLKDYVSKWVGSEILAFCGPIKYRGILSEVLEGDFLVLKNVAIISPGETAEYTECVLNVEEVSGIAHDEAVGRGEAFEEF